MKTKLSVLLLNAFLIISSLGGTKAQVTIGHSEAPETHATLQIKNQTAGTVGGISCFHFTKGIQPILTTKWNADININNYGKTRD